MQHVCDSVGNPVGEQSILAVCGKRSLVFSTSIVEHSMAALKESLWLELPSNMRTPIGEEVVNAFFR